jgi:hypothetical protein
MAKSVTSLDFHEHDTGAALDLLQRLVDENRVAGIVFAVAMKRGDAPLFGATGRLASNDMEAAGLSLKLGVQFVRQ